LGSSKQAEKQGSKDLRRLIQGFVRSFGLLDQSHTPCGRVMAVSEAHALMELMQSPGMGQLELSQHLCLSKSAVSRLVARLEGRELVRMDKHHEDGRACSLRLTAKGKRLAAGVNQSSLDLFDRIISALPNEKQEQLFESLTLLVSAVRESREGMAHE
jgi:MarR family transcriptional regulator, organic hydroperoxide resistance regulator